MIADGEVFLTGATGFVGSHVLDALLAASYRVRALARPGARRVERSNLTWVEGDLTRTGDLVSALSGCRSLVHVAALYSFAPAARREMRNVNVVGTAGLLEAAREAGVERAVVTSSSATVGPMRNGDPATEEDQAGVEHASAYHGSKIEQERAALAARIPTVLVLPTAPVGPGDRRPTPTGKMIVDFMRGRMFASLGGGLNLVPVEDVGRAHVLALEHGRRGERYLVGGENLRLAEIWQRLGAICGRPAPQWEISRWAAFGLGLADEVRCRIAERRGREAVPLVPLEGVRMAGDLMFVSSRKAAAELGYEPSSVTDALTRAVTWYRKNGYA